MIKPKWIKIIWASAIIILLIILIMGFTHRRHENLKVSRCRESQEEVNGHCYELCRSGFAPNGVNCYEICKTGEMSQGLSCTNSTTGTVRNILSYERQAINESKSVEQNSGTECADGFEIFGTMCMEKCKDGFSKLSFFCAANCEKLGTDKGIYCAEEDRSILKKTYIPKFEFSKNTNVSNVMACVDGYTRFENSAICIQVCPAEHAADGGLCIEQCKAGETDLDTMCLRGHAMRPKSIIVMNISGVPVRI